jgi:hypothetical protein
MIEKLTGEYRMHGLRLVSLVLIASFAFIPVRCTASDAPHSIFVSPNLLGMSMSGSHAHHSTSAAPVPERHVPGHDPAMGTGEETHTAHPGHAGQVSDTQSATGERASHSLARDNDPQSQQPVGATLDLPPTSVTPGSILLLPLESESFPLALPDPTILDGMTIPPEAPPPKTF